MKVDLLDFDGRMDINEYIDWLQDIEKIFEYKEISQECGVSIIVIKLKKSTYLWWEKLKIA